MSVFDALAVHAHKFLTSADGADSTYAVKPDPVQVCFETAHPVTAARPVMFGDELQAEPHPGIPGLEVIVCYGRDGALVVQIDTKEIDMISRRGRLRVNLNDDQIYDGDPDTDTPPGIRLSEALQRAIRKLTTHYRGTHAKPSKNSAVQAGQARPAAEACRTPDRRH